MKKLLLSLGLIQLICQSNAQQAYTSVPLPSGYTIAEKRAKTDFKVDAQNNIWITFGNRKLDFTTLKSNIGLAKFNGISWSTWNTSNSSIPTNALTCLAIKDTTIWIGSSSGLIKKSGETFTVFNQSNSGIVSDSVTAVATYQTSIWVGTTNGISKYNGSTWTTYSSPTHNLADNRINAIFIDKTGKLWVGTNQGLSTFSNNSWTTYSKDNSGLKTNMIHTISQSSDGVVWLGTDSVSLGNNYYPGLYAVKDNVIMPSIELNGNCSITGALFNVNSFTPIGNQLVIPIVRLFWQNSNTLRFSMIGQAYAKEYQLSPYSVSLPSLSSLFLATVSNNLIYWCANDYRPDSLFTFNPAFYEPPLSNQNLSYLNINKVSTPILNRGDMFWDLNTGGYEVPKGGCKRALFASTLWMGGLANGNLRIAAQTYRQNGSDYFPGPLKTGTATTDSATMEKYDRIWRINRQTIEEFKIKFAEGKVTSGTYPIPENFKTWPAHGDYQNGYGMYLAPFVDLNDDGLYNPMDGDYPKIKGDQMLYWIFNDNGGFHGESQGASLGVEIHASAYAFTCDEIQDGDSNAALNYTTFYHYDIINKSQNSIDSPKVGIWTDIDLGNYNDDYIGCNPKKNYAFGYNGDDEDEGPQGYGTNPPAIGIALLNNDTNDLTHMTGFRYYNNDFSSTGNPTRPEHYWAYLNNTWKDGSPLTYGGNGKGGTDTASFMFPGDHDLSNRPPWSEASAQNAPGDRRMVMNVITEGILPGSIHSLEYAIVYSRATSGGALASVAKLDSDIDKVRNWYANQSFPSCLDLTTGILPIKEEPNQKLTVYPNPANQSITLSIAGLTTNATVRIIDITGRVLLSGTVSPQINIQDLQPGVYFIDVKDGNKQFVSKFVKN
jgi:hypothetical protein